MRRDVIATLIDKLGSSDAHQVKAAGDGLLEIGRTALPYVLEVLRTGSATARKAAAFLAGRMGTSAEAFSALIEALRDEEPKVRKNSAIALGQLRREDSIPALEQALQRETISWVRPSLVLAIGKIGGEGAKAVITKTISQSKIETDALRKALDRLKLHVSRVDWSTACDWSGLNLFAVAPVGLEDVLAREAVEHGIGQPQQIHPGLLQFPPGTDPRPVMQELRCMYHTQALMAKGPSLSRFEKRKGTITENGLATAIAALLREAHTLHRWTDWIACESLPLRYRFSLVGLRVAEADFKQVLGAVREELANVNMEDSPSNYSIELIVDASQEITRLWLKPGFESDTRFGYRKADVGASINPVIGACLARLVRSVPEGVVFDPTCGSATLLIERALLDPGVELRGLDVSPTAVRAARINITAARLTKRTSVKLGNAIDLRNWQSCDEVIANLPFGIRTRTHDRNLHVLYARIVQNAAQVLKGGGRALFYTANADALRPALTQWSGHLIKVDERYVVSGGLRVGVWVTRKAATAGHRAEHSAEFT